jgi:hypothetical protein
MFIVTGMHRSGTSLAAGLLHNSGIFFGDDKTFLPKPDTANPKGFYENIDFREMNDGILSDVGYDVKSWSINIPDVVNTKKRKDEIRKLIQRYNRKHLVWGVKDPRFCLTWEVWPITEILIVYRNPLEVAKSLKTRDGIAVEQGLQLWNIYNSKILKILDKTPGSLVEYTNLLTGRFLQDKTGLIDSDLHREKAVEIPASCRETWKELIGRNNDINTIAV